jgi:hypothetical protein
MIQSQHSSSSFFHHLKEHITSYGSGRNSVGYDVAILGAGATSMILEGAPGDTTQNRIFDIACCQSRLL